MDQFSLSATKRAHFSITGVIIGTLLVLPHLQANAEEVRLDLDAVEVVDDRISDTQPVKGYTATTSTSATRTETPLIDVPQSITVITKDAVKDLSVQSLAEAVEYVPGVQAAQGEGNRDAIIFRGNQTTSDLFVDGMRDDVQIFRDLYNTENLEIVKGANGMVSGRGGAGGIINRATKQAGWDPVREIRASYGAYNHKRAQFDVGQGINDVAAFRLNGVFEDSDSYRSGVDLKRYGIAPTITLKPSDNTKIRLSYEYFKDERIGDRGFPSVRGADNTDLNNRPYDLEDYNRFFGNAALSPNESEVNAFSAFIEHDFENGFKLKNSTRYADYDKFYQNLYPSSAVRADGSLRISSYRDDTDRENFTNQTDLIYTLKAGSVEHKLLGGFEFTKQDNFNSRVTPEGGATFNVTTTNSTVDPTSVGAFTVDSRKQEVDVDVFALYLQDQIKLSEQWQVIAGVRYDRVDIDYENLLADPGPNREADIQDDLVSPRIGLIYKPLTNTSIYANYSLTKVPRAGDQLVDLRSNTAINALLDPEEFTNKEIGFKWDITPRLALNAAAYILERDNLLINDPNQAGEADLADGQETKGLELSLSGQVTNNWSVLAAITLQDGELTDDIVDENGETVSASGSTLANTPQRSLSVWNKYQINDIWAVALGVVSVSERLAALETNTSSTIMPGYTRYDAAIFADFTDNLRLQINIENLTDKAYAMFAHNNNNITPGSPLTGRATLVYNF